jgi:hypothetical protein
MTLALAGLTTLVSSTALFATDFGPHARIAGNAGPANVARQCTPAVADPSAYTDCRLRRVEGAEARRYQIVSPAQRLVQTPFDQPDLVTGTIPGAPGFGTAGLINTERPNDGGRCDGSIASPNPPGGGKPCWRKTRKQAVSR